MDARVKSGIWVSMALRLADIAGRAGAVLRKGDPDSGGILCVLRGREGLVVLSQVRDAEGRAAWMRGTGPAPVEQAAAGWPVEAMRTCNSSRCGPVSARPAARSRGRARASSALSAVSSVGPPGR